MAFKDNWNRRTFLGTLGALVGTIFSGRKSFAYPAAGAGAKAGPVTGFGATGNVYEELGVTTVINGQGTMTVLGGSMMRPEVEAVMAMAGRHFVSIPDLELAAGKRIAEILKLPEGYGALVTSGAAAAMQSGLAGILTGDNPRFIEQLPDLTGMKSEVIIQKLGKEEIVGMVKALESYLKEDHEALNKEWQRRLDFISSQVTKIPGVTTSFPTPEIANHVPHLRIKWDSARIKLAPREVTTALRGGKPSIVLSSGEHGEALSMNSFMLKPGEEKTIAQELVKFLKAHTA